VYVVVADEFEVCGTYNRNLEVNEPVISWSEAIVDGLGRLRGPAVFCCQRLHRNVRSTEDAKIFLVVRRG